MRIVIVADDSNIQTGKETAARWWAGVIPRLAAAAGEVRLVTLRDPGPVHTVLKDMGYEAAALHCRSFWQLPAAIVRLARYLRRVKVDVIDGQETIPAFVAGCAGLVTGVRVRIYFRHRTVGRWLHSIASRVTTMVTTMTIAPSEAVARCASLTDRAEPSRIRIIPNGIAPLRMVTEEEIAELKFELGVEDGSFVILSIARLRPEKTLDTALAAGDLLAATSRDRIHLVIVGTGPEEERLKLIASRQRSLVSHFVGHQNDVAPWYGLADVVCIPSRREPFGLVALEAMSASKPVIASRVDGLPEVVAPDVTALVVDPGDVTGFAEALNYLKAFPSERRRLGEAGRERFETSFTLDSAIPRWAQCYRDALAGHSATRS